MKKLLLLCISAMSVMAIVTIEPVDIGAKPDGNSNEIEVSLDSTSGNSDTIKYNIAAKSDYATPQSYAFVIGDYHYGKANDAKNIDKYFIHTRFLKELYEKNVWEIFAQVESNAFQALQLKTLLGSGVRYKLDDAFYLGLGAMAVREKVDGISHEYYGRVNLYIAYKRQFHFNSPVDVIYTGYYQPRLDDLNDYLILQNMLLRIPVSKHLKLNYKLQYSYDPMPPFVVKRGDFSQSLSLSYQF